MHLVTSHFIGNETCAGSMNSGKTYIFDGGYGKACLRRVVVDLEHLPLAVLERVVVVVRERGRGVQAHDVAAVRQVEVREHDPRDKAPAARDLGTHWFERVSDINTVKYTETYPKHYQTHYEQPRRRLRKSFIANFDSQHFTAKLFQPKS